MHSGTAANSSINSSMADGDPIHIFERCSRAHVRGCLAKPALERSIEIRNVGKARRVGDIADLAPVVDRVAEQPVSQQQAMFENEARKRHTGQLEQMLNISRAEIATGCNPPKRHVRPCQTPKDFTFDGIEASRGKAAMGRKMGGVGIRAEAKRNEVEHML